MDERRSPEEVVGRLTDARSLLKPTENERRRARPLALGRRLRARVEEIDEFAF